MRAVSDRRELRRVLERVLFKRTQLGVDDVNVICEELLRELVASTWFDDRAREALLDAAAAGGLLAPLSG